MLGTAYEQERLCSAVVPKNLGSQTALCFFGAILAAISALYMLCWCFTCCHWRRLTWSQMWRPTCLEPNVSSFLSSLRLSRAQVLLSCIQNSTPLEGSSEQNPRALLRTNVILAFCPDPLNLAYHNGQKRANHFQRGQSVQFLQGAALKGAKEA